MPVAARYALNSPPFDWGLYELFRHDTRCGGAIRAEIAWEFYEPGKYTDGDVIAVLHAWSKSKQFKDNVVVVEKFNPPKYWMQLVKMVKPGGLRDLMLRNPDEVTILESAPLRFKVHPDGLFGGLDSPWAPERDSEAADWWGDRAASGGRKADGWSWSGGPCSFTRICRIGSGCFWCGLFVYILSRVQD